MIGEVKFLVAAGVLCAFAALSGCTTVETVSTTRASSAASASTGSVAVSVSTETATVTRSATPPPPPVQQVDVISGANKPCGTVAADAPKFVEPAKK